MAFALRVRYANSKSLQAILSLLVQRRVTKETHPSQFALRVPSHPALCLRAALIRHPCLTRAKFAIRANLRGQSTGCSANWMQTQKQQLKAVTDKSIVIPVETGIQFFLALVFAVSFASVYPLSVASQRWFCQGKMHMDVHFSFDKPGRRIKTALKQNHCCEGSRRPTRPGWPFLGYFFWPRKRSNSPAGEKGALSVR